MFFQNEIVTRATNTLKRHTADFCELIESNTAFDFVDDDPGFYGPNLKDYRVEKHKVSEFWGIPKLDSAIRDEYKNNFYWRIVRTTQHVYIRIWYFGQSQTCWYCEILDTPDLLGIAKNNDRLIELGRFREIEETWSGKKIILADYMFKNLQPNSTHIQSSAKGPIIHRVFTDGGPFYRNHEKKTKIWRDAADDILLIMFDHVAEYDFAITGTFRPFLVIRVRNDWMFTEIPAKKAKKYIEDAKFHNRYFPVRAMEAKLFAKIQAA